MTFDLNLLLTFEAMDKARSVSGAARLLGLSQPATSAALSRLRRSLGDELFTYAGGTMQPTPAARRLAPGLHAHWPACARRSMPSGGSTRPRRAAPSSSV
jgi:DNA-binding transcriptional LysR family regulator